MRLKNIKLAGFKSFVDPTVVPFPSNLCGIVGPNGCGKSNIVDAIRWVMGETSAKYLRGESMADVIFNGSSARKPVGQASVELHFDNSEGKLVGEYAKYTDIALKRTVTRDGQSNYYLNGTKCRRKDIIDIFLGTGLGSRSYSVIEQGMISRFIEAKPEELRIFLEEAAGVSKYKERRRETETRLRHTRENLERLHDVREEIDKQLEKLDRQAKAAEKYKIYKEEERQVKAQLLALHWREMDNELKNYDSIIKTYEVKIEEQIADQRRLGAEIEKHRQAGIEASDQFNEIQVRYYALGTDIARLEQTISHYRERVGQLEKDKAQVEQTWQELTRHTETDQQRVVSFRQELSENEPALRVAKTTEEASSDILATAETTMNEWQTQWDIFNQQAADAQKREQVEHTRIHHLDQRLEELHGRIDRMQEEFASIDFGNLEPQMTELQQQAEAIQLQIAEQKATLETITINISQQRQVNERVIQQLDKSQSQLQQLRGRQASLHALQQAVLGEGEGSAKDWLAAKQLQNNARLAQQLEVTADWEQAVETVLGEYLEAICVNELDKFTDFSQLQQGQVLLIDQQEQSNVASGSRGDLLLSHVKTKISLGSLLDGVYCVAQLADAMAMRSALHANESVVTKEGVWLSKHWLRVNKQVKQETSVIQREQELKRVNAEIIALNEQVELLQNQKSEGYDQVNSYELQRDSLQHQLTSRREEFSKINTDLQVKRTSYDRLQKRSEQLQLDIEESNAKRHQYSAELEQAQMLSQEMQVLVEQNTYMKEELAAKRTTLRQALDDARQKSKDSKDSVHRLTLQVENARTQLQAAEENLVRMQDQMQVLSERREQLDAALAEGDAPIGDMQQQLDGLLEKRLHEEHQLNAARRHMEELQSSLRDLENARDEVVVKVENLRSELEQQKLNLQTFDVRRSTYEEQIVDLEANLQELLQTLPEEATIPSWTEQLQAVAGRIQRLGAINLAAIEEYKVQSERKEYLDAQYNDLMEALNTLEAAIHKIDKETKDRFRETFETVNRGFQTLFPKVFGGGSASLELMDNDLLTTGITVMARPPGKRNSSIHLLSGGEKALTAISLVFSIFQLNPAPFCLLDEVDAPLDDSNVNRFCNLVKEMSKQVQFMFISHNKLAIEMADHLTGVTMQEAGVSRIVAVDVQQAVEMAEA